MGGKEVVEFVCALACFTMAAWPQVPSLLAGHFFADLLISIQPVSMPATSDFPAHWRLHVLLPFSGTAPPGTRGVPDQLSDFAPPPYAHTRMRACAQASKHALASSTRPLSLNVCPAPQLVSPPIRAACCRGFLIRLLRSSRAFMTPPAAPGRAVRGPDAAALCGRPVLPALRPLNAGIGAAQRALRQSRACAVFEHRPTALPLGSLGWLTGQPGVACAGRAATVPV